MSALAKLHEHGLQAEAKGDRLEVFPADRLNDELRQYIRRHKPELLRELARLSASEQALVNEWLDRIGETDPEARREWLDQCARDREALLYSIRELALHDLDTDPALKYAFRVVDPDSDPVRLVIAIWGNGTVDLLIPAAKWDPFTFMELLTQQREAH